MAGVSVEQDPDSFWASPVEHVKEFFRALVRQSRLPSTWPALILLVVATFGTSILAVQIGVEAFFKVQTGLPFWITGLAILAALYFSAVVTLIGDRRKAILEDLERYSRKLVPGCAAADDAIIDEVMAQVTDMGIWRIPDIHIVQPGDHPLAYAAQAHAGFIDRGRVALHEFVVAECCAEDLRMIIRHELAHIKNRDGVVRAAVDVVKRVVDYCGQQLMTYFIGLGGLFAFIITAFIGIGALSGAPLKQTLAGAAGMIPVGAGIASVSAVIIGVTSYVLWVYRRQEFNADRMAATGIGRQYVETGVRQLHLLEGDDAIPPKGMMAALRWRLLRTHPTPTEREERLRKLGLL